MVIPKSVYRIQPYVDPRKRGLRGRLCQDARPSSKTRYAAMKKSTSGGAWLDGQYSSRARVRGHADHFRRWGAASAGAMRSQPRELDVRYGGGTREHLDIFPAGHGDAPV